MNKVWFITGSARGLGRHLTEAVLEQGDQVAATARNTAALEDLIARYPQQILPLSLDVTDNGAILRAVADTVAHFGRIDVLVNNAGFGVTGAAEAFTDEQVRSQLEANLYAPIQITRAVLPYMRAQGSGRILQVSSVGGRVGTAGVSIYQAAKFGVSGFTEALRQEVEPLGIFVTSIEPGGFRTDWAGNSMDFAPTIADYAVVNQRAEAFRSGSFEPMGDPAKAAQAMLKVASHRTPPVHLVLGSEAVALLEMADATRKRELEQWRSVSLSTDHDDATPFLETPLGKAYAAYQNA